MRIDLESSFLGKEVDCYHFDTKQTAGKFINANMEVNDNNIY